MQENPCLAGYLVKSQSDSFSSSLSSHLSSVPSFSAFISFFSLRSSNSREEGLWLTVGGDTVIVVQKALL